MIRFLLLFCLSSFAQDNSLDINGQNLIVSKAVVVGNNVTAATLLEAETLIIGGNVFGPLPAGTNLSFFRNEGLTSKLSLRGIIVTEPIADQIYRLANGRFAYLNCGRIRSSVAFVEFSDTGELIGGCRASNEQSLLPPHQENEITVHKHSPVRFFKNGLLRSAVMTSGLLKLKGNEIELRPQTSISFYENQSLHFFHPELGESFSLETALSPHTDFRQPNDREPFPVLFHPNGQISTAWINLENTRQVQFQAFGSDLSVEIQNGPVGFDPNGQIDRLVIRSSMQVTVMEPTYIRSTEQSTGVVSLGLFRPGMTTSLPSRTQLFLRNQDDTSKLAGYPERGEHGLVFFNELSSKPF